MKKEEIGTYQEAEAYILGIPKFAKKNTAEECRRFYDILAAPAENKKIIHVAGTNGKGSVCSYLNQLLIEGGYKTGMFTSPHLISMRERFQINGEMVSQEQFLDAFLTVMKKIEAPYHPTFFEILFFMGMLIFEECEADYIILETGLGGRLDATNIIQKPCLAILTEIGMDHMEFLGETLKEIAMEKAGIIKPQVPVLYIDKKREVSEVIEEKSKNVKAPCYPVSTETIKSYHLENKKIDFSLKSRYYDYVSLTLPTQAIYQMENALLAISALELIQEAKSVSKEQLKQVMARTRWEGRMEEVAPNIFVDGAHNVDGIAALIESLKAAQHTKNILLFSAVQEKEYSEMIKLISESALFTAIIITEIENSRKTEAKKMEEVFKQYTKIPIIIEKDVFKAFALGKRMQQDETYLYIAGSLYLVGMIKEIINESYR